MASIISPTNTSVFRVGQKAFFYSEFNAGTVWSFDPTETVINNELAVMEGFGVTTLNSIQYNYCFIKFKKAGSFYLRVTNITGTDTFTTTIYGIDVIWAGAKTTLWNTDVGSLCKGLTKDFNLQKINKWSLFKPIRSNIKNLAEGDIWDNAELFKKNGAGMKMNKWNSSSSLIPFYWYLYTISREDDKSWQYLAPRGTENNLEEYFRLGDFRGYTEKFNQSYFHTLNSGPTILRKETSGSLVKENWDKYTLENNSYTGSLLFSDIWTGDTISTSLGNAYLMVYVKHNNKHFFRTLKKLSDQESGSFDVETPIDELFSTLVTSDTFFEDKGEMERYYFIANGVKQIGSWIELTGSNNSVNAMYYGPATVMRARRYLTEIFREAFAVPVTSITKNCSFYNNIIYYTDIPINFTNEYTLNRNIYLDVKENETLKFNYFKEYVGLEEDNFTLKNILNNDEYTLVFNNTYRYDVFYIEVGSPPSFIEWYRPTMENEHTVSINLKELLQGISEENWYDTLIKIELKEESILPTFYNENTSNKNIIIEFLNSRNCKQLSLNVGNNAGILDKNDNFYEFKNLSEYSFKIVTTDNTSFSLAESINITSIPEEFTNISYNIEEDGSLTLNTQFNLGNGFFDNYSSPLELHIEVIF